MYKHREALGTNIKIKGPSGLTRTFAERGERGHVMHAHKAQLMFTAVNAADLPTPKSPRSVMQ